MNAEHEHLLRANVSWYHAYGHDWRTEQESHERALLWECLPDEREQDLRLDYRQRVRDAR